MKPKRVVSLLVAGCMAVSMVPASAVTAFAETVRNTSALAVLAQNAATSGPCGAEDQTESVSWEVEQNNTAAENPTYTLSIEGSGAMADYNAITDDGTVEDDGTAKNYTIKMIPVRGLSTEKKKITKVVVEEGFTLIGDSAFPQMVLIL